MTDACRRASDETIRDPAGRVKISDEIGASPLLCYRNGKASRQAPTCQCRPAPNLPPGDFGAPVPRIHCPTRVATLEELKKLGALIIWLSGAAAGLTALLYAMGFIATLAHLNVLGIEGDFASREAFEYIGRGASAVWGGVIGAVVPGLFVVLLWELISRIAVKLGKSRPARPSLFGDAVLVLAMIVVAVFGLRKFLVPALDATSLLFANDVALCGYVAGEMTEAIVRGDHMALGGHFLGVAVTVGIVASLAWLGARRMLRGGGSRILVALYAVTVIVMVLVIPVAHGVYLDTVFPRVELAGDGVNGLGGGGPLRLLQHGDKGMLLWSTSAREVFWMPADGVQWLRVGDLEQLFPNIDALCPNQAGSE